MMSTIDDYYEDRADVAPFASGDSDILEDITFTDYADVAAFLAANADWQQNGTVSIDPTNGLVVNNASSSISANTWSHASDLATAGEGSIYLEIERDCICVDEGDIASNFLQSTACQNDTNPTTAIKKILAFWGDATTQIELSRQQGDAAAGQIRFNHKAGGNTFNTSIYVNSQRSFGHTDDEHQYAKLILTWKGNTVQCFLDGIPVSTDTVADAFTATTFNRFTLGNGAPTGGEILGDYSIRRLQVSKRQSLLVANPMRIAFLGDSFMRAFIDSADYTNLADIQTLSDGTGRAGYKSGLFEFIRAFASDHNMVLTKFLGSVSTANGHGFCTDVGFSPFDSTEFDAIIADNPEILITAGSFNDVNTGAPATDIYTDTKNALDTIIDGCRSLREIHFFAQFAGHKGSTSTNNQDHIDESERLRGIQRALDGYTRNNAAGETVKVFFHETYDLWGGDDYSEELSIGSATGNTVTANADIHPSSLGHIKMAEIMYKYLEENFTSSPVKY